MRLLKHIIRCYLRLSDNPRAREALRQCLPEQLRDPNFTACLKVPIPSLLSTPCDKMSLIIVCNHRATVSLLATPFEDKVHKT